MLSCLMRKRDCEDDGTQRHTGNTMRFFRFSWAETSSRSNENYLATIVLINQARMAYSLLILCFIFILLCISLGFGLLVETSEGITLSSHNVCTFFTFHQWLNTNNDNLRPCSVSWVSCQSTPFSAQKLSASTAVCNSRTLLWIWMGTDFSLDQSYGPNVSFSQGILVIYCNCMLQSESLAEETCTTIRWCTSLTLNARDLWRQKEKKREEKLALPIMK